MSIRSENFSDAESSQKTIYQLEPHSFCAWCWVFSSGKKQLKSQPQHVQFSRCPLIHSNRRISRLIRWEKGVGLSNEWVFFLCDEWVGTQVGKTGINLNCVLYKQKALFSFIEPCDLLPGRYSNLSQNLLSEYTGLLY